MYLCFSACKHQFEFKKCCEKTVIHLHTILPLPTGNFSQKAACLALSWRQREACSFVSHSIPQLHHSLRNGSRNGFHSLADMIAACRGQKKKKEVFSAFLKVCHIVKNIKEKRKCTAMFSSIFNEREREALSLYVSRRSSTT